MVQKKKLTIQTNKFVDDQLVTESVAVVLVQWAQCDLKNDQPISHLTLVGLIYHLLHLILTGDVLIRIQLYIIVFHRAVLPNRWLTYTVLDLNAEVSIVFFIICGLFFILENKSSIIFKCV